MNPPSDPTALVRRSLYGVLIFASAGMMIGRILAVDSVSDTAKQEYRIRQELDRTRQFLVNQKKLKGQELDDALAATEDWLRERFDLRRPFLSANDRSRWCTLRALVEPEMRVPGAPYAIDRVVQQPNWDTIDMVKRGEHFYSSKPPLFPTLLAGPYWVIYRVTGATLGTHPFEIGRGLLVLFNVVPMLLYFFLMAALVERLGHSDWSRVLVMGAATLATFLTTFAVVLNNHLPAAVCAAVTLYCMVRIWQGDPRWRWFVLAGFAAALLVSLELPALAWAGLLSLAVLALAPRQALLGYAPAAALVAAAFFGTNWIAVRSLTPAYIHRSPGDDWYDYTYQRGGRTLQSYWKNPVGIDRGEPRPDLYAVHVLAGHHGIFTLTPLWLLSAVGLGVWLRGRGDRWRQVLAIMIAATTLVCLAFYLTRPLMYRNYGGMAAGLRWMFWFAPLWLVAMLPAADWMASHRWARGLGLILLGLSALSAAYPTWNPWTHPWLFDFFYYQGWASL